MFVEVVLTKPPLGAPWLRQLSHFGRAASRTLADLVPADVRGHRARARPRLPARVSAGVGPLARPRPDRPLVSGLGAGRTRPGSRSRRRGSCERGRRCRSTPGIAAVAGVGVCVAAGRRLRVPGVSRAMADGRRAAVVDVRAADLPRRSCAATAVRIARATSPHGCCFASVERSDRRSPAARCRRWSASCRCVGRPRVQLGGRRCSSVAGASVAHRFVLSDPLSCAASR